VTNRSAITDSVLRCVMLIGLCVLPGCRFSSWGMPPQWPAMFHGTARIPSDATKEDILAVVNECTIPIHSWRATSAKVGVSGIPVPMGAMIAVEEPNHLRMKVSNPLSGQCEVEIGSNSTDLWFWMREMEPKAILAVCHQDLAVMQQQLPVPVQPDWMMEVLGVKEIDGANAELLRDPENPYIAKLVSHHTNETGHTVRKITTVDLRKGEVREHELFDADHRLVASARLTDYQKFPNTSAKLPRHIKLNWAQQDKTMTLTLNGVEINPPHMPSSLWEAPQIAGCPVKHLGRDQLMQHPTAVANRSLRDKPKAITEYELDQPSGAWMQNQFIKMPDQNGTAGKVSITSSTAEPENQRESPYFTQADLEEYRTVNAAAKSTAQDDTVAPPFPGFDNESPSSAPQPQPGNSSTADQADRRSRDGLLLQ